MDAESLKTAIESMWQSGSVLIYFPAFAAGVLISFTPCVYPVLPIIVSVVTANAGGKRLKAFALALVYVVGMSIVYAVLGMIVAMTKLFGQFGEWSANPYILFIVANIFVAMGLWMMGVFDIPLPGFLTRSRSANTKGYKSTFMTGMVSAFVVGPCSAPALGAMVLLVQGSADASGTPLSTALYGATMMFAFALGMGTLLIIAATFSGVLASMPRPGAWMVTVKKLMGLMLILVGEFFILMMGYNGSVDGSLFEKLLALLGLS